MAISIELLSCNSEWRQGIVVSVNGSMDVDVGRGEVGSEYVFWEEIWTDLKRDEIYIWGNTKDGTITIYNVWDDGSGRIDSFYNGSAMIKEVINNKEFIYYCNDGHFDDDFNDIIFKVKIL